MGARDASCTQFNQSFPWISVDNRGRGKCQEERLTFVRHEQWSASDRGLRDITYQTGHVLVSVEEESDGTHDDLPDEDWERFRGDSVSMPDRNHIFVRLSKNKRWIIMYQIQCQAFPCLLFVPK